MAVRLLVLTDRSQVGGDLLDVVASALEGGATEILLREKDLPRPERAELANAIIALMNEPAPEDRAMSRPSGARTRLIVASDVELAWEVGAAGVHLAASDPWPCDILRRPGPRRLLVGRSCHDENELLGARDEGADYVTLSPIFPTASKPGYVPALGLDGLATLGRKVPQVPVVALGGITPGRVGPCLDAGAAGVAVMGEVMRADDPAGVVRALADEPPSGYSDA